MAVGRYTAFNRTYSVEKYINKLAKHYIVVILLATIKYLQNETVLYNKLINRSQTYSTADVVERI